MSSPHASAHGSESLRPWYKTSCKSNKQWRDGKRLQYIKKDRERQREGLNIDGK